MFRGGGAKGGGGGGGASDTKKEATLAEVQASRDKNTKEYEAGMQIAKETCIQAWKEVEDDSITESEFEAQINHVIEFGMVNKGDHFAVKSFMAKEYKALNGARVLELNRLTDVQRRLEAKLNEADDGILSQVRDIVPGYERVIKDSHGDEGNKGDEAEFQNLLKINKLLESVLLQQGKHKVDVDRNIKLLEDAFLTTKQPAQSKPPDKAAADGEVKVKVTMAQVIESMKKNERSYRDGMKEAKQNCINEWKTTDDESISESSFEAQLDQAIATGKCESSDHFAVKRFFISSEYKTLNQTWDKERNRLSDIQKSLEAELNALDDDIVIKVSKLAPGYERVTQGGNDEFANLLRINKLVENVLLMQEKHMEEVNRRFDALVAQAAAEKAEKAEKDRIAAVEKHRLTSGDIREVSCTFSSQGDTNGVLHYIGTKGGTVPYANPHNVAGGVVASASSIGYGTVDAIVGRDNIYFFTNTVPNSYIKVDLGVGRSLILNHYSFKHGTGDSNNYIRSWRLEGSNDDSTWITLKEHTNDSTINAGYAPGSWPINLTATATAGNPTISYRFFRILKTGPDRNGYHHLMLCCLELYGKYSWGESTSY